ncbi:15972_t:CDS:2 [Acaulospora morrowiae]|uniref:15972_t:CDS:1 n=1 Tax=Acaulospora morrowiae TaxID=94023 RepID=A0A9N9GPF0_9GLOM|nr:15972_t:CDS:2 [Acaulospora morrowiae]
MPKSKKKRIVPLTVVKKKKHENKSIAIQKIQDAVRQFNYIWRIETREMRNPFLQQVRVDWATTGRKALGEDNSSECEENLSEFTKVIENEAGILCTNESVETVKEYLTNFIRKDFARTGSIINETVTIPAGLVKYCGDIDGQPVPHILNAMLNKLGLPSVVDNQMVIMPTEFTICRSGDKLSEEQSHLLKQLGYQLSEFKLVGTHYYDKLKKETITL